MIPKTVAALDSGTPPDVAYADVYDFQVTGKWAFDGKLEDISDVITPMKDKFLKNTIETTYLYNDKTKKQAYYAFPLKQQTMHIQYWKDMLAEAGYKESDIPTTWKEYWDFWCDKAQPAHRNKTGKRIYGIGQPMGVDSQRLVLLVPDVHGRVQRQAGRRQRQAAGRRPEGARGPHQRGARLHGIRTRKGCTPPSSTSWKDPGQQRRVPQQDDPHDAQRDDLDRRQVARRREQRRRCRRAERDQAKKNYYEIIATAGFPNKPDGSKFDYRAAVKTGVIFADAKNKKRAKEFVAFLLQDENLHPVRRRLARPLVSGDQVGRRAASFWQADPHRKSVYNQFAAGTVTFEFAKNYKFTILNNENVWAKAMSRVVNEKWTPEKATDEMIARIKQVAG